MRAEDRPAIAAALISKVFWNSAWPRADSKLFCKPWIEFPPWCFQSAPALLFQRNLLNQIANESPRRPANAPANARTVDPATGPIKMKAAPNLRRHLRVPSLPQNKFPVRPAPTNAPWRRAPIRADARLPVPA